MKTAVSTALKTGAEFNTLPRQSPAKSLKSEWCRVDTKAEQYERARGLDTPPTINETSVETCNRFK